jgi:hypothetical protein
VLLSDPEVSRFLAEAVVPCWESVRPVPQVTIDFGNGQVLRRTLAGNTVLYLCLPDGRVVDAFPGVYTPLDFLPAARRAVEFIQASGAAPTDSALLAWHKAQLAQAAVSEQRRITLSKRLVESPLLFALSGNAGRSPLNLGEPWDARIEETDLNAAFTRLSARLEDVSKAAASASEVRAEAGGQSAEPPPSAEELGRRAVVEDSRTNVQVVRPAVHLYLAARERTPSPRECRDVLYKQVLHVPLDDPYLGLKAALVPGSP